MASYGQFCPVAKAMELLDERWTMLVVRELAAGSTQFNELRRGVPRMSPTLLSKRLRTLARAGVVDRAETEGEVRYRLTPAGEELRPVVEALGAWGSRWIPELGEEDLDPHLLMWDVRRNVVRERLPEGRTVIAFRFTDASPGTRDWWLVVDDDVDVCHSDPGFEVQVRAETELRLLVRVWRGDVEWADVLRAGTLRLEGPTPLRRAFPTWFARSPFATVPRPEVPVPG